MLRKVIALAVFACAAGATSAHATCWYWVNCYEHITYNSNDRCVKIRTKYWYDCNPPDPGTECPELGYSGSSC